MAVDSNTRYGNVKPVPAKKKPVPGSKGWGSIRAAEYGNPELAIYENLPFKGPTDTTSDETFSYDDTTADGKTGAGGGGLSALDRYTRQLQAMLTGGTYRKPFETLQAQLQGMYTNAGTQVNTAMDDLNTFLKGQTNPYAGLQAQATQVTPALSELLQSQGVSTNPLQQLAAVTQAQNTGQTTAFNNLMSTLSNIQSAGQAGQITDVAQQRADLQNQLTNSNLGYGAQIAEKGTDRQKELMTMLLTALSKGGNPKKGRLF